MKCLMCEKWSYQILCARCLSALPLTPRYRILLDSIKVYSFYRYEDVAFLMQSKYHLVGSRILKLLSFKAARHFFTQVDVSAFAHFPLSLVGLDDYPYGAYSHVGVIASIFARNSRGGLRAYFGALKAHNNVKYAGTKLAFRQNNPKDFRLIRKIHNPTIVLIDDIITTGSSFMEAIRVLEGFQVLFCLALCDARE